MGGRGLFPSVLFFEDGYSHVVDGGVVENYNASVWARLDMHAAVGSEFVVASAEIVADGLYGAVELVGYFMHGSIGQTVFDATEVVE